MQTKDKEKKEKKCRAKLSNKTTFSKAKHNWVVSFDPRYSVCRDCGAAKRN